MSDTAALPLDPALSPGGSPRRDAQVDRLVGALVNGASVADAARAAGVSRSTGYAMLQEEPVRDRLRDARTEALAAATERAAALTSEAVGVLGALMRDGATEGVRLRAADLVLTHATTLARDQETAQQLADLQDDVARLSSF